MRGQVGGTSTVASLVGNAGRCSPLELKRARKRPPTVLVGVPHRASRTASVDGQRRPLDLYVATAASDGTDSHQNHQYAQTKEGPCPREKTPHGSCYQGETFRLAPRRRGSNMPRALAWKFYAIVSADSERPRIPATDWTPHLGVHGDFALGALPMGFAEGACDGRTDLLLGGLLLARPHPLRSVARLCSSWSVDFCRVPGLRPSYP